MRRDKQLIEFINSCLSSLSEATKLHDKLYEALQKHLITSRFWQLRNDADDIKKRNNGKQQTPLVSELESALNEFILSNLDENILIDAKSLRGTYYSADDKGFPNDIISSASAGFVRHEGAQLPSVQLNIKSYETVVDSNDIDQNRMSLNIATVVRHELTHIQQISKAAANMGSKPISTQKALQKDPKAFGSVDLDDDNSRELAYMSSYMEMDSYAHEIADRLASELGIEQALKVLRSGDITATSLSRNIFLYFRSLKGTDTAKKVMRRAYSHLVDFKSRGM